MTEIVIFVKVSFYWYRVQEKVTCVGKSNLKNLNIFEISILRVGSMKIFIPPCLQLQTFVFLSLSLIQHPPISMKPTAAAAAATTIITYVGFCC